MERDKQSHEQKVDKLKNWVDAHPEFIEQAKIGFRQIDEGNFTRITRQELSKRQRPLQSE